MNQEEILSIFKKYGTKPLKYLGQNFLIDKSVLEKIINAADLKSDDIVLEVGPGLGALTIELVKRIRKVIAIEKDKTMYQILQKILNVKNAKLINADILKINMEKLKFNKVVANIPYYITSPLIRGLLETETKPEEIILMVQKEVAQRICAVPPHMSILSVAVQFYGEPKSISFVSKNSFYPRPKVDSAIIKIVPKRIPDVDAKKFFALVKRGFSAKRKMLKNNLPGIDLEKIGINPHSRAENLSINDWLKVFHNLKLY
jgi:16S rRNA (adenine1518-N6/adenine1519-N6)-dimethyltransferase